MQMITTLEMAFRSKVNLYSMLRSINKHDSKELGFRNSLDARRKSKRKNISLLYWKFQFGMYRKRSKLQFCIVVNFIMCFYPMRLWRSYQAHYRLKWKMFQCLSIITTAMYEKRNVFMLLLKSIGISFFNIPNCDTLIMMSMVDSNADLTRNAHINAIKWKNSLKIDFEYYYFPMAIESKEI